MLIKHTPGPWGIINYAPVYKEIPVVPHIYGAQGFLVATVNNEFTDDEGTANAALIAAAPALLRALEVVEWVHLGTGGMGCAWCRELYPNHTSDCRRQHTLRLAAGTKEKR